MAKHSRTEELIAGVIAVGQQLGPQALKGIQQDERVELCSNWVCLAQSTTLDQSV